MLKSIHLTQPLVATCYCGYTTQGFEGDDFDDDFRWIFDDGDDDLKWILMVISGGF